MSLIPEHVLRTCLAALATIACATGYGQLCGTADSAPPPSYLYAYRSDEVPERSQLFDSVGVAVHVIDPGQGLAPDIVDIQAAFDQANDYFQGAGLHFFLCDINTIQGFSLYSSDELHTINRTYFVDHRVNVYLVNNLTGVNSQPLCGVSTFPWEAPEDQRLNALTFECLEDGQTLAHELGHYFGLLHTHDISKGFELVDGSNCATTGDLHCDTPADPGLGFHNVTQCQYTGAQHDAQGHTYVPDPTLIMSYTPANCATHFTSDQLNTVRVYVDEAKSSLVSTCSGLIDFALSSPVKAMTTNFISSQPIPLTISGGLQGENGMIDITYWISDDPVKRGMLIKRRTVDLAGKQLPLEYNLDFIIPPGRDDGLHYLTIKLDGDRQYIEQDEWNNEIVIALTLVNSTLEDAVIFPNPADHVIHVFRRFPRPPGTLSVRIFDMTGRLVQISDFDADYTQFYIQMGIPQLLPGMYQMAVIAPLYPAYDQTFLFRKN